MNDRILISHSKQIKYSKLLKFNYSIAVHFQLPLIAIDVSFHWDNRYKELETIFSLKN